MSRLSPVIIVSAMERTREPIRVGSYYVFDVGIFGEDKNNPKYVGCIWVKRGPRGGYQRPSLACEPSKAFRWQTSYIWLTREEYVNDLTPVP